MEGPYSNLSITFTATRAKSRDSGNDLFLF